MFSSIKIREFTRKCISGFSSIEIIVALSVLSIAFFGLIQVFPMGVNMNESSRNRTVASYLAQEKIEKLFSKGYKNVATGTVESKQRLSDDPTSYLYNYQRETEVFYVDGDLNEVPEDMGMKRINTSVYYLEGPEKDERAFQAYTLISQN